MPAIRSWNIVRFLAVASLLAVVVGCGGKKAETVAEGAAAAGTQTQVSAEQTVAPVAGKRAAPPKPADPLVVLHTTAGDIKIQLFAEKAPQTVENFLTQYAARGYYDKTIFHHVEPGQMLIGGGFDTELVAKPPRTPIFNESRNGLSNRRGTLAMIRDAESPHTATSQFFINLGDNPDLDFKAGDEEDKLGYCVFGEVIEGIEIVERISKLPTSSIGEFASVPSPPVSIQTVERLR